MPPIGANAKPSTLASPDAAEQFILAGTELSVTRQATSHSATEVNSFYMRVLGIDCGGAYTGYGVVEMHSQRHLCCLTSGAIVLSPREPLPRRLARIFTQLSEIIARHQPDEVAIEEVFYALNVKSALKLGQVRGVAMLAAATAGLEVAEYSPLTIKSSVVGYGRAEKQQVQHMVTRLLELAQPPESLDASDALAIAICHLHTAGTLNRQRAVTKIAVRSL
jgi:crossover junction endodeoxyribonuclease RuvC